MYIILYIYIYICITIIMCHYVCFRTSGCGGSHVTSDCDLARLPPLRPPAPERSGIRPILVLRFWILRGFDSSIISISRGGLPRPIGDFPKSLSQAILAGIISVGRSGVARPKPADPTGGNKVDDANKVNMQLGRRCSRAALDNVTNNCNNNNVLINVLIIELLSMY